MLLVNADKWGVNGVHTHTEGRYGAGAGVLVWPCLSSVVLTQGLAPGVLGEIGIVGVVGVTGISTWNQTEVIHLNMTKQVVNK